METSGVPPFLAISVILFLTGYSCVSGAWRRPVDPAIDAFYDTFDDNWFQTKKNYLEEEISYGYKMGVKTLVDRWAPKNGSRWWNGKHVCKNKDADVGRDVEAIIWNSETNDTLKGSKQIYRTIPWDQRSFVNQRCMENDAADTLICVSKSLFMKERLPTLTYKCCPGYIIDEDECVEAFQDLVTTMNVTVGATKMTNAFELAGMINKLWKDEYTIFAPVNSAFNKFKMEPFQDQIVIVNDDGMTYMKELRDLTAFHLIRGEMEPYFTRANDTMIATELPDASIRINWFHERVTSVMTANCVPVKQSARATNGWVHTVDTILEPVKYTLKELVSKKKELSIFSSVLKGLELNEDRSYTMFAFTNSAFNKLSMKNQERLLNGSKCGQDIFAQHILQSILCLGACVNSLHKENIRGGNVDIKIRPKSDSRKRQILVNGVGIVVEQDLMATNGVLHVIDRVILGKEVEDLLDVMATRNDLKIIQHLIEESGLVHTIRNLNNFTIFLPTDDAFAELSDHNLDSLTDNIDDLQAMIRYHIVPGKIVFQQLHNDDSLPTHHGVNEILVKEYHSSPFGRHSRKTVQCGVIQDRDLTTCRGMAHTVNKVFVTPDGNMFELLKKYERFSMLVELLESSGDMMEVLQLLQQPHESFTMFAPTNRAFQMLPRNTTKEIKSEPNKAKKLILSHVIIDALCCSGVFTSRFLPSSREVNVDGWMVAIDRTKGGVTQFGGVPIKTCDMIATNGIVHSIDEVLPAAVQKYFPSSPPIGARIKSKFSDLWNKMFS